VWRQLRLHALEALVGALVGAERFGDASAVAAVAVAADPLRESARRTLITVHLSEGNRSEAIREFDRYRALLLRAMGIEPSGDLRRLVVLGERPELMARDGPPAARALAG
jgi:DNA-binding SARP family transcriptional activator